MVNFVPDFCFVMWKKCVIMSKHHGHSSNNFVVKCTKSNEMSLNGRSGVI